MRQWVMAMVLAIGVLIVGFPTRGYAGEVRGVSNPPSSVIQESMTLQQAQAADPAAGYVRHAAVTEAAIGALCYVDPNEGQWIRGKNGKRVPAPPPPDGMTRLIEWLKANPDIADKLNEALQKWNPKKQ